MTEGPDTWLFDLLFDVFTTPDGIRKWVMFLFVLGGGALVTIGAVYLITGQGPW